MNNQLSDAQVEASALKALVALPQLADQAIVTHTVYGTVTLTGVVRDEATRQLTEDTVAHAAGVKKVVDELTLASAQGADQAAAQGTEQGTNPLLQSDGTMAPGRPADAPLHAPDPDVYAAQHGSTAASPDMQADGARQPSAVYRPPFNRQPEPGQPYPQANSTSRFPQPAYPPYGYPYGTRPYPPVGYPSQGSAPSTYGAQIGGQTVTVAAGSLLRIRINEGLDSAHTQPGTVFDGVVLNDVVADGAVAIPRGATVQGKVVDAKSGGVLKGHGELALQLTQVTLGGRVFPLLSDVWQRDSSDKGLQTINSTLGLGAAGAVIGAIAGGGAGAAIGAGVGGAAGLGTSAANGPRQVLVPSEAILTFHSTQPAQLTTLSQAEMDRLSYGVPIGAQQSQMRRRYPVRPPYYPGW